MNTGRVDINHVLMQMRSIKEQMNAQNPSPNPQVRDVADLKPGQKIGSLEEMAATNDQPEPPSFGEMFKSAVDTVNANQKHASNLAERFEVGDPSVDLPEVMIAAQKSSVSFQAMTEVRNKMVEAYKEIMNMPL